MLRRHRLVYRLPTRIVVFVTFIAAAVGALIAAQTPTFRTGVRTVPVYVTVQDDDGRLVPDLTQDAFRVLEDGRPVDIVAFSRDPQPLSARNSVPPRRSHILRGASLAEKDTLRQRGARRAPPVARSGPPPFRYRPSATTHPQRHRRADSNRRAGQPP